MPAMVAIQYNPDLRRKYEALVAKGKPPKVALTAVMRKLLVLANTLVQQEPYLDAASAAGILLPGLPGTLPGERRSRVIEPGTNGRRSRGVAREATRQVTSRKTGIRL